MIYLTYYYDRDIFKGTNFKKWIVDLFGDNVHFCGSEGKRFPVIRIPVNVFESKKDNIPTKNLVGIEGCFSIIEQLVLGVRDFKNTIE